MRAAHLKALQAVKQGVQDRLHRLAHAIVGVAAWVVVRMGAAGKSAGARRRQLRAASGPGHEAGPENAGRAGRQSYVVLVHLCYHALPEDATHGSSLEQAKETEFAGRSTAGALFKTKSPNGNDNGRMLNPFMYCRLQNVLS